MKCGASDPLAITTAIHTLAVAISQNLDDDALAWLTAVLVQLSGSLTMIAVQRSLCQNEEKSEQTE